MNTGPVVVEGPHEFNGVRVDHPSIVTSIRNLIAKGYGQEQICKLIGMPGEVVDRERRKVKSLQQENQKWSK